VAHPNTPIPNHQNPLVIMDSLDGMP